ncbi:hypothetical protein B0H14DRAFT_2624372, partial [Mycena olivaceomarginata]
MQNHLRDLCGRLLKPGSCKTSSVLSRGNNWTDCRSMASERWKEYKPSELTPMYARGLRQFYIEEVAQLADISYVIPVAWIKREGVLCADCLDVTPAETGWKIGLDMRSVPAVQFTHTYHDVLQHKGDQIKWADGVSAPAMPNKLRDLAGGDDLYVVMVPIWADDVSGNKSKQYNKHIN